MSETEASHYCQRCDVALGDYEAALGAKPTTLEVHRTLALRTMSGIGGKLRTNRRRRLILAVSWQTLVALQTTVQQLPYPL